jgi:hypothetical protein
MTTYRSPISLAAIATLVGSVWSKGSGSEDSTAQKAQFLVHFEPSIIKAAVGIEKHSLLFGHLASSQTVASPKRLSNILVSRSPPEFFTFTHAGNRKLFPRIPAPERCKAYLFLSIGIVFKNRKNTELCQIRHILFCRQAIKDDLPAVLSPLTERPLSGTSPQEWQIYLVKFLFEVLFFFVRDRRFFFICVSLLFCRDRQARSHQ